MESVIQVISKLHEVFSTLDAKNIQLPQIAVVGAQSAGKSSVLESIVGRTFLPRGTGIVTRRPLILNLIRCPLDDIRFRSQEQGTMEIQEWGEFLHRKGEIFTDFENICNEIKIDTARVAGEGKGVCEEPIHLTIYSSTVVDLTMIDLPGLTKVPVGDQPENIEILLEKLIRKYIENPNCIILAVTAANSDIANSDALKFAKQVDPVGSRTLAVLTKIDIMDKGTNAVDMLTGNVLPVKLGIIGVINRTQEDINLKKTINEQLKTETEFFQQNYSKYAHKNGTAYLAKTLSILLIKHIQDNLPELKKRVNNNISECQTILEKYGDKDISKDHTLYHIIKTFAREFKATINGEVRNPKMTGNTFLYSILHENFEKTLCAIKAKVPTDIETSAGPRPVLFDIPFFDASFVQISKENIEKLREPSLQLIDAVRNELLRNAELCSPKLKIEWQKFPKLKAKIFGVIRKLVNSRLKEVRERVEDIVDSEKSYINIKNTDFRKEASNGHLLHYSINSLIDGSTNRGCGHLQIPSNLQILSNLVGSYFKVVTKAFLDAVPKAIMCKLVGYVEDTVESELILQIYKGIDVEGLLDEGVDISEKRQETQYMLTALKRANDIINEIYQEDYNIATD